jgi:hypothetical protein
MDLYKKAVDRMSIPMGQAIRIHPTLPIYENREARIFCYWDHEARLPWQTEEYYDSQRKNLRPATFARLHQNQWVSSESSFISAETYDSFAVLAAVQHGGTPSFGDYANSSAANWKPSDNYFNPRDPSTWV